MNRTGPQAADLTTSVNISVALGSALGWTVGDDSVACAHLDEERQDSTHLGGHAASVL